MRSRQTLCSVGFLLGLSLACSESARTPTETTLTPSNRANVVVSNNNDVLNGNTSTPQTLTASPGPDGISLREALIAVNNVAGPHTITFAPGLAGMTISPLSPLPPITRDQVTITGLTTGAGQPNIIINGDRTNSNDRPTLFIAASEFTVTGISFVRIPDGGGVIRIGGAVVGHATSPHLLRTIRISGNSFSDAGYPTASNWASALSISTSGDTPNPFLTSNSTITDVVISSNTFSDMAGAISFDAGGNNNVIQNVTIFGNTFSAIHGGPRQDGSAIELAATFGTNNRLRGTQILQNTCINNLKCIDININDGSQPTFRTSGNIIEGTDIERNIITRTVAFMGTASDIQMVAGVGNATNNAINNVQIINNLINSTTSDIGIAAQANDQGATGNTINGVSVINLTLTGGSGAGIGIAPGGGVSGLSIVNTILDPTAGLLNITAGMVANSITCGPPAGTNRNFCASPMFVNPAVGDLHLQSTSPARGAGTSSGAPAIDLDCQPRGAPPSIGAYELNGPNVCSQTQLSLFASHGFEMRR